MDNTPTPSRLPLLGSAIVILALAALAAVFRLLPHPPNFTPVAAVGLLAGTLLLRRWWAFAVPVLALLASDLLLGFYDWRLMAAVYLALALPVVLTRWIGHSRFRYVQITAAALTGAVGFFLITNAAVWLTSPMYPPTLEGLVTCYLAAVPFFRYTVAGNLVWALSLFAAWDLGRSALGARSARRLAAGPTAARA